MTSESSKDLNIRPEMAKPPKENFYEKIYLHWSWQ